MCMLISQNNRLGNLSPSPLFTEKNRRKKLAKFVHFKNRILLIIVCSLYLLILLVWLLTINTTKYNLKTGVKQTQPVRTCLCFGEGVRMKHNRIFLGLLLLLIEVCVAYSGEINLSFSGLVGTGPPIFLYW